jgi:adenylate cyclase
MGIEIERKYLIYKDKWQPKDEGASIRQGYLCTDKERTVRVRTKGKKPISP